MANKIPVWVKDPKGSGYITLPPEVTKMLKQFPNGWWGYNALDTEDEPDKLYPDLFILSYLSDDRGVYYLISTIDETTIKAWCAEAQKCGCPYCCKLRERNSSFLKYGARYE